MNPRLKSLFLLIFFCVARPGLACQDIDHPGIKWTFKTGGPVRAGGVISENRLYFGSSDGFLYCLNKDDGGLIWSYETEGALTGSPTVAGNSVFIAGRDRTIYHIDAVTGELNWKYQMQPILTDAHAGWDYFMPAPTIVQDKVLIGGGDGILYALQRNSGDLLWKFETRGRIRATTLVSGGVVYQPSNDGSLYAINPANGRLSWKFETLGATYNPEDFPFDRSSIFAKPLIAGNILILASRDGNTYGVDLTTHQKIWNFTYGPTWAMASAISDSTVYVGWSTNNTFCALDLKTGKETWKFQGNSHFYGASLILEKGVYVGSADGMLYRFNKDTGEKIWEYPIGSELYTSLLYDSGTIYFGSDDGNIYALKEGETPYLSVYQPSEIKGNAGFLVVDPKISPYLGARGFEILNSELKLQAFVADRLKDHKPSVIVFALPLIPREIMGEAPENGLMRQYLDDGGKVVWMGDVPNYYEPDEQDQYRRDARQGSRLLGVEYLLPNDSGHYFSISTQEGLNWGLPSHLRTTGSVVDPEGVIPFTFDEFGRVNCWMKRFNPRPGSGFISVRSFGWNTPIKIDDLELIYKLATYGLK